MFHLGLVILSVGAVFAALGSISFKFRAITNKKAWDGKTRPLLFFGAILIVIGMAIMYIFYPF